MTEDVYSDLLGLWYTWSGVKLNEIYRKYGHTTTPET